MVEKQRSINLLGLDVKQQKKKKLEHCCEKMDYYLNEGKVAIYYNSIFREYFISLRSYRYGRHVIYNCPWCGYEFPPSLIEVYYEIIKKELNLYYNSYEEKFYEVIDDDETYDEIYKDVPEEFTCDEWWKKRGL